MAERGLTIMPKELQGVRLGGGLDFDQLFRFAQICHASGLFEDVTDAAQAFAKIAKGQEMGLPPMTAMSGIDIIRKRLFLKPWVIAAKINACGYGSYRVLEQTAEQCAILFRRKYAGEGWLPLPEVTYTYAEAKAHGLTERSPHWKASPAHMLYQRCMGRGGLRYFPELLAGLDVPQEEEPLPEARHRQNVVDLFGDGQGSNPTAYPPRPEAPVDLRPAAHVPQPFPPLDARPSAATAPAAGEQGLPYVAQIEAAIVAYEGHLESWYVWAERRYKKGRDAFTVADWEDFLAAVRAGVQTIRQPVPRATQPTPAVPAHTEPTAPFVDPETGEVVTPDASAGPSWGPEDPNLFLREEEREKE